MAHHHRLPASTRRTLLLPPSSTKKACWASSGRRASSTVYSILPGCQRGYRRRSGKMAHYCHDRRQSRQAYKPREPEVCHATVDCRTRTIRCGFCALSANAFFHVILILTRVLCSTGNDMYAPPCTHICIPHLSSTFSENLSGASNSSASELDHAPLHENTNNDNDND